LNSELLTDVLMTIHQSKLLLEPWDRGFEFSSD
jgi:hypothetical protein